MTAGVRWTQVDNLLPSRLQVAALAEASVGAAALAAAELAAVRNGGATPEVQVDSTAVAAAFASDRALRLNGQEQVSWSPLSKFWRSADGWVRTHCNYPHHQARLLDALDVRAAPENGRTAVGEAIATSSAEEVAERVTAFGGLAVVVRNPQSWAQHEQGSAVAGLPLLELRKASSAASRPLEPAPHGPLLPAAGLRILDLSRVVAGPVATRTLAFLGADVLRIDSPDLPELTAQHLDTGMGKRSALLDLRKPADLEVLEELLSTADVVVSGYRPGALDRFGLGAEALLRRRPSLVVASLSGWGRIGHWSGRRAFDSLVQAACGIADIEAAPDGTPGAMPVQALDHATGYLLAAAVLRALACRAIDGGGWIAELSLAQTAAWLLRRPIAAAAARDARTGTGHTAQRQIALGALRYALSPVMVDGGPRDWVRPVGPWGADAPEW